MSIEIDKEEALSIDQLDGANGTQLMTSLLPDASYTMSAGAQTALEALLGTEGGSDTASLSCLSLIGTALDDAVTALTGAADAHSDSFSVKKKTEKVTGYGTTSRTWTWSGKEDLGELLLEACPEGALRDELTGVDLGSGQKLTLLRTAEG